MKGIAKGLLIAILVSITIMLLTNMAFFFPWYTTLIVETFSVTQAVSTDNYLKESYYDEALSRLENRPIYRERTGQIEIEVLNSDGMDAIGNDDPETYYDYYTYSKPYRQRGEPLTITIKASYPLEIKLWGKTYSQDIDIDYSMETTGLRYCKDLPSND